MKKIFGALLSLIMVCLLWSPLVVSADVKEQPSRAINVVYDDSTSMIVDDFSKESVDRWCQAKYAMEVFASMLGEKDTMSIYAMSDFVYSAAGSPMLTVSGSEPVEARVQSVHHMITAASNTPFESADQAFADLQTASADEKWLVILMDSGDEILACITDISNQIFQQNKIVVEDRKKQEGIDYGSYLSGY